MKKGHLKRIGLNKDDSSFWAIHKEDGVLWAHFYKSKTSCFAGVVTKDNNRGWTIETNSLGSGTTYIFLSRGDWEFTETN